VDSNKVVPVWTLATSDTQEKVVIPGTDRMTSEVLQGLRSTLAAIADVPIATLEAHPLPANLDRRGGIHLESTSPLATHLAQLVRQTPNAPAAAAEGAAAGEVLYRMVVPAKVAKQVSQGLVNPVASKAVSGGIHGTLKGTSRIVGQSTFVPVASKGATVGAGGAAVAGAGVMTVAAPLVLMAVAVGVSAYADQQRQKAIAHITELVEKLHDDQLARERSALNGCRDAIEKATSVLLDQGRIGASLGLDSAVHTISTALAEAEARLTRWKQSLIQFGDKPVELPALQKAIKGIDEEEGEFRVHLQLAKAAIELKKRVIVLQAVEHAQGDESNPFESFVRTLNKDKQRILELESGMTEVLTKLSQLKLTRSKSWADKHLLTSAQTDQLLSVAYRLQALGDELPSNERTDVAIEIAQERDGSIVVFPALPA
jgi:hypothetical protein